MIVDITAVSRDLAVHSIAQLEGELFGRGAWNENMVREELDAPTRTYLLDVFGETEQTVVRGYAGFWYDGEAHQRQGIAAALLKTLIDKAKRQGAARMLLEVRVDNEPALALYQRFGFERMGLRKRYYQPEGIDAYTMSLDLKPRIVGFAPAQTVSTRTTSGVSGAGTEHASNDTNTLNENTTTNGEAR